MASFSSSNSRFISSPSAYLNALALPSGFSVNNTQHAPYLQAKATRHPCLPTPTPSRSGLLRTAYEPVSTHSI
jgi:hypothetical protein